MAWDQLNSSLNAFTDRLSVITSSVLSNETTDRNESADSKYAQQLRLVETEKNVLQKEALRLEAEVNKYRTRWLQAEDSLQQVTGSRSEVYEDEVDLSDSLATADADAVNAAAPAKANDECTLAVAETNTNVGLVSAVAEIHRLQDELHKVNADREHWRQLAKHKTSTNASIEEQLDDSRLKIKELEATLSQLQSENFALRNELAATVEQLRSENSVLESSLVDLDEEHQKEINKIISVKNELAKSNVELTCKYDSLYNSYCKLEQENSALEVELQNLRKDCLEKESDGESFAISSSTDVLRVADRQEPEGAPINSDELVSHTNDESDLFDAKVNASLQTLQLVVHEKDNVIKCVESKSRQFELEIEQLKLQLDAKQHNIGKLECELKRANDALAEEHRMRRAFEQLCAEAKNAKESSNSGAVNESESTIRQDEQIANSQQTVDSQRCSNVETTENSAILGNENNFAHLVNENEKLSAELERLRKHLVEIEENYTQELLVASERESEVTSELQAAKELIDSLQKQLTNDEKLDKLREQLKKVSLERDKALEEISQLDDKLHKSSASVANLQLVIEQIQKENDWKLEHSEKQYEEGLANEKAKCNELKRKLRWYEEKHLESKNALDAAARLTEQIDVKEATIKNLKSEIASNRTLTDKLVAEINELKNSFEGKVDKQIIKSLVLGYFNTPQDKKHEVQRLLARILDFNQDEMQKAGLQIGRQERSKFGSGNWSSLSQSEVQQQSLAKAFVQFLESESTNPKVAVHELAKGFTNVVSEGKSSTTRRPSATPSTTQTADNQLLSEQTISNLSSIQPVFIPTSKS